MTTVKSTLCKPEAVLFDLDGTVLHSAVHFVEIINRLLQQASLPLIVAEQLQPAVSSGVIGMLKAVFGADIDKEYLASLRLQFLDAYESLIEQSPPTYFPGIDRVFSYLQSLNIPYGIVTNKQQRYGERVLAKTFFQKTLGCVIYGDTLTCSKPSPEPLWLACKQLKVSAKATWFVGDSLVDMQAADRAGCAGVLAAYGYVDKHWRQWPCAHVLQQPIDLVSLL